MVKPFLAAGSIALALAVSPATGQQSPSPEQPKTQQVDPSLVGQSLYSSDGQKLGQISEVGLSGGEPAVRADLGEFLGTDPGTDSDTDSGKVIIGAKTLQRKADRVEIAMTAQEVKDTILKQRQKRKQP